MYAVIAHSFYELVCGYKDIAKSEQEVICVQKFFFGPMPPHVLVDFVVLPPGHGSSVTDF